MTLSSPAGSASCPPRRHCGRWYNKYEVQNASLGAAINRRCGCGGYESASAERISSTRLVLSHVNVLWGGSPEMAVHGGVAVDGSQQVQVSDDDPGAQVEYVSQRGLDLGGVGGFCAERFDADRHRLEHADGVGDLYLTARRRAGGDDVLGRPARRVGAGAVDFAGIFAGVGPAAVSGHAAVGVHDDLASGEARSRFGARPW